MQTQTPPAEPAKKKLSPAEFYDQLGVLANSLHHWRIDDDISKAQAALDEVKARKDRVAEKQLRIMGAASIEEAKEILAEVPADTNLKKLCGPLGGWKKMQEDGATDAEIAKVLFKWPTHRHYPWSVPAAERGYGTTPLIADMRAWVDPDKLANGPAHLKGVALIAAVRRVMNVPKPSSAKPATKSAAAKKPSPKSPSPKKPPAKKPTGATAEKPEPSPASAPSKERQTGPEGKHSQTWNQWAASLRSGGVDLPGDLLVRKGLDLEQSHYVAAFKAGMRPAAARDAWKKGYVKPAAAEAEAEPEEEDIRPDKSKVQALAFCAADLKLDGAQLSDALDAFNVRPSDMNNWKAPATAAIGRPFNLPRAAELGCKGGRYAVVSASVKRDDTLYQLVPLYTPIESNMEGILMVTWAQAREADPRKGNPPESVDLIGIQVFDDSEPPEPWILGSVEDAVYVSVAKTLAPPAPSEDDAAARAHFSAQRQETWDDLPEAARPLMMDTSVNDQGFFKLPEQIIVPFPSEAAATWAVITIAKSSIDDQWRAGHVWQGPAGNGGTPACVRTTGISSKEYAVRYEAGQLVVHLRQLAKDAKGEIAVQMKAAVKAAEAFVRQCPKGPEGK